MQINKYGQQTYPHRDSNPEPLNLGGTVDRIKSAHTTLINTIDYVKTNDFF